MNRNDQFLSMFDEVGCFRNWKDYGSQGMMVKKGQIQGPEYE